LFPGGVKIMFCFSDTQTKKRKTDGQTDIQIDRWTERQTEKNKKQLCMVKPEYNNHPWDLKKVTV
jgi:hypothetical protein